MSLKVRTDLMCRKRKAGLQRVLLPKAPPRKRATRKPSPERDTCPMVETEEVAAPNPTALYLPAQEPLMPAQDPLMPAQDPLKPAFGFIIKNPDEEVIETTPNVSRDRLGDHAFPSTSAVQHSANSDKDKTLDNWLKMCDSDDDVYIVLNGLDHDADSPPTMIQRDASTEPSCLTDLSTSQAQVLVAEDQSNDAAIRNIAANDNYIFEWTNDVKVFTGQRETFTATSGPTKKITNRTTELDVFYDMFDSEFIDSLCTETNRYADQKLTNTRSEGKLSSNSRLIRWTPTDRDEMITFLAIMILQGLYPQVQEEAYFSFNGFGTMPYFSRIMSYNRFLLLKSHLNFVDNDNTKIDRHDKIWKLKPVIDYLNEKFSSLYTPEQEVSLDESLLKWHGGRGFSQKNSSQAVQTGVKTYELCESSSGYLWKFSVAVGKKRQTHQISDSANQHEIDDDNSTDDDIVRNNENRPNTLTGSSDFRPTNATAKIVYDLLEPLLHRGHTVIMDNFYNSPLLLRCLKRQKTDCYGTLRLNRENVPDSVKKITKSDLRHGEVVATYCPDLSIMVWRDANLVTMISTYHYLQIGKRQKVISANKPQIVLDYNKSMSGVNRKDQFLFTQPIERVRNKVWYKKLFQRLYSIAIFNCYVIYSSKNPKVSQRQFRTKLAEKLLVQHRQIDLTQELRLTFRNKTARTETPRTDHSLVRPTVDHDHFPVRCSGKRSRCWMCNKRKVDRRTKLKCMECNIPLCIYPCFRAYHKL